MTSFRAFTQTRFFHFDEVTHVCAFLQLSTRAQTCEWTNGASGFQMRIFHHTVWAKLATLTNHAVFDDATGANLDAIPNGYVTFNDNVSINFNIAPVNKRTAKIKTCRIAQHHACQQQFFCLLGLINTFQTG